MGRILGRVIVVFTCLLIGFIAYSSQIFIIWPWFERTLSFGLLQLLVPFNILIAIIWWNYWLTVKKSPGRVPPGWQPNTVSGETFEVKRGNGRLRYCRACNGFKPPRAHHCRECGMCTLRMDHHCPWMNNCIGHFNYPSFVRFLFFVDISCAYHLAMVTWRVWDVVNLQYWSYTPSTTELVFIVMNYVTCLPVMCGVGLFSLYHFYLLATNTTTIEGWEKDKVAMLVRRGRIEEVKFPYNIGMMSNIRNVMGPRMLWWCWPTAEVIGDGLSYPVAEGSDVLAQYTWPPKDSSAYHEARPLPDSPWTYGSSVNPRLRASNARLRKQSPGHMKSTVPPYHADYDRNSPSDSLSARSSPVLMSSDDEMDDPPPATNGERVRRGSEGWEVRPLTTEGREELVRRYIERHAHDESWPTGAPGSDVVREEQDPGENMASDNFVHRGRSEVLPDKNLGPLPPDKYRRYLPSADEERASDDDKDNGLEPGYRDLVWEAHIDLWEGRRVGTVEGDMQVDDG